MALARRFLAALTGVKTRYWEAGEYQDAHKDVHGSVAILLTGGIGDSLLALPLLKYLRELLPDSRVIAVSSKLNHEILKYCPVVDEYVDFPSTPSTVEIWRLARKLRAKKIKVIIGALPSNLKSHSLLVKLVGAPRVIKHLRHYENPMDDWQFWFTDLVTEYNDRHNLMANLDLLGPLGLNVHDLTRSDIESRLGIVITPEEKSSALDRLGSHTMKPLNIGFHPGCKPGWEFKRWQPKKYAQLADKIHDEWNAGLFWFGGPDEAGIIDGIMGSMNSPSISYTGSLELRETAALISVCDYFISNDSGLMHVAAAVGTPVTGLFSSSNPRNNYRKTGPFGSCSTIASDGELYDLSVEKVYSVIQRELNKLI